MPEKTTVSLQVDISKELHRRLKMFAARNDLTIKASVTKALQEITSKEGEKQ